MAGAFTKRLPPPRGVLTRQSPVKMLSRAVEELQRGAAAGLVCTISGISAQAEIRDNIIYLSGRVVSAPGDGEPKKPPYPDDGEFPGTDVDGGEWDESDSGSASGGGPEPVVPFTGEVQTVKSVGVALAASGTRLTVTLSFVPLSMQFISGKLVSAVAGSAQQLQAHVDGEECGP